MSKVLTINKEYVTYWWQFDSYMSPLESDYEYNETLAAILTDGAYEAINNLVEEHQLENIKDYLYGFAMQFYDFDNPRPWMPKQTNQDYYNFLSKQKELLAFKSLIESWPKRGKGRYIPKNCSLVIKEGGGTVLQLDNPQIVESLLRALKSFMGKHLWIEKLNTNEALPYYDSTIIKKKYAYYLNELLIERTHLGNKKRGNPNKRYLIIGKIFSYAGTPLVTDDKGKEYVLDSELKNEVGKVITRIGKKLNDPNYRQFY